MRAKQYMFEIKLKQTTHRTMEFKGTDDDFQRILAEELKKVPENSQCEWVIDKSEERLEP